MSSFGRFGCKILVNFKKGRQKLLSEKEKNLQNSSKPVNFKGKAILLHIYIQEKPVQAHIPHSMEKGSHENSAKSMGKGSHGIPPSLEGSHGELLGLQEDKFVWAA